MKKPETKFRAKVDKILKSIPNSWWESIQQKAIRGTPDKLGCINGVFIALELKAGKGEATALQDYKLVKIREAGGIAYVLNEENFEEVMHLLNRISESYTDDIKT